MKYLELAAHPPLDQVVRCFWFLQSNATSGPPQPVVADGRFEIVLHAAEPFARLDTGGRGRTQEDALLAGQLTAPIVLQQRGRADIVGIRLRTGAAGALLRHPLSELNDEVASLGRVAPSLRDRLLLALHSSIDPHRRREALSAVLLREIRGAPDPLTMAAVADLDRPDAPRLASLARSLGTTTRTLERRIAQATGLTPRSLLQTMRFRRVFHRLQAAESGSMAAIALEAGYFDQSHCIRDFRRFTGQSPREFFTHDPALALAFAGEAL